MWVNEQHNDWDVLLPYALFAYNISVHRILHETPFYLQYGRDARIPIDYIVSDTANSDNNATNVYEYAVTLVNKLQDVHTRVIDILSNINDDRRASNNDIVISDIAVGDMVWLYKPNTDVGKSKKLTRRWVGPYLVTAVRGSTTYEIERNGKKQVVHVNRLKKAYIDDSTSIRSFASQLQQAKVELDSISQAHQDMIQRQIEVKQRVSQLKALVASQQQQVEQEENNATITSS